MSQTSYAWRIGLIASMGGLLFGYDWVVISGAKPFYEVYFGIEQASQAWLAGWAVSSAVIGCLVGSSLATVIADRIGRKRSLAISAFLFVASAVFTATATNISSFVIARMVGGSAIGLASCTSPIYLSEIAPSAIRGKLVATNQLAIVVGILYAQLTNLAMYQWGISGDQSTMPLIDSWLGQSGWRWMFAAEAFPAGVFLCLTFWLPESPRWLVKHGDLDAAKKTLKKIAGQIYSQTELETITQSSPPIANRGSNITAIISNKGHRKRLSLGIALAIFQQWCGINVIFNYADDILTMAGFPLSDIMFGIVLTGGVNLLFTILAISMIDRIGRRPLMLLGAVGLFGCFAILGFAFWLELTGIMILIVLLTAISIYAMTLAPVTWVLLSEIFPNQHRGALMGLSVSALWAACFVLTLTFKPLSVHCGPSFTFWLYSLICLIGSFLIYFQVPETKGKTLESIEMEIA